MNTRTLKFSCTLSKQLIKGFVSIGLVCAMAPAALAETYPDRPIRLIVPFPPGGAVDAYARIIQPALTTLLGQTVVVENRAGASGIIGTEAVSRAAPDGYTLLLGNIATFAMNPAVYKKMPYDPVKGLTPITKGVIVNYVLAVNPEVPAKTVAELIAYAKTHPGKLTYGSSGKGSAQFMAAELFKSRTGTDILHVPYKGTGELIGDLVAGHVNMIFADQGSMMPQAKAGRLRVLGVGGLRRAPDFPEIPTIAEAANLPNFEAVAWQGFAGPPGLPVAIVSRVSGAINKIQTEPAVLKRLNAAGLVPDAGTPEDFSRYIKSEIAKWSKVANDVGATAD